MALIKCGNCGSEVSNIGKCPKCGALICQECGHVLDKKSVKCPNCGKGTIFLKKQKRAGWIGLGFCLISWPLFVVKPLLELYDGKGGVIDIIGLFAYVYTFVTTIYIFLKYGVRNRYS